MYPVIRPEPVMEIQQYKTYTYATPPRTHYRPATCEEYLCSSFLYGFMTLVDISTDLGRAQADYIRKDITRSHKEEQEGPSTIKFIFPAGTPCWRSQEHLVPVDRPPILFVRGGDWRASTGLIRRHSRTEDWVDDFAEHQGKLADRFNQG